MLLGLAACALLPVHAAPIGTSLMSVDALLELRPKIVEVPVLASATLVPPLVRDPLPGADNANPADTVASSASSASLAASQAGLLRFTVLDANMWLLPSPWAFDQEDRLQRFLEMIASYQPEIVTLQEVWLNMDLGAFRKALPGYWAAGIPPSLYNRSGLVVFSRFPITNARYGTYPWTRDHSFVETLARKGFLQIDLDIGGRKVRVVDSHLYASRGSAENRFPVWQFEILRALTADVDCPTLVAGDLNIRQEAFDELNAGHFSTEVMTGPAEERGTTVRDSVRKIDYILGRHPQGCEITVESRSLRKPTVSDHLPVLGRVTIRFGAPEGRR